MASDEGSEGTDGSTDEDEPEGDPFETGEETEGGDPFRTNYEDELEEGDEAIEVEPLLNHVVYVSVVFAVAGIGFGVLIFLMARFGADATIIPGQNRTQEAFVTLFINDSLNFALIFPLFLSPVTGLVVNFSVEDDLTALVSAAGGGFVGAVLFVMFAGITADLQYPMVQTMGQTVQGSFDVTAGFVNSLLVGFVTAGVGGVSAVIGQLLD